MPHLVNADCHDTDQLLLWILVRKNDQAHNISSSTCIIEKSLYGISGNLSMHVTVLCWVLPCYRLFFFPQSCLPGCLPRKCMNATCHSCCCGCSGEDCYHPHQSTRRMPTANYPYLTPVLWVMFDVPLAIKQMTIFNGAYFVLRLRSL